MCIASERPSNKGPVGVETGGLEDSVPIFVLGVCLDPQPGASDLSHTANLQTKAFADEYKCSFRNTHLFTHVLPASLTEFKNLNVCNIQLHSSLWSMGKTEQRTAGNFLALVRSVGKALPAKPAGQGPRGGGRELTPVSSLTSTHRGGSHLVPTPAFIFPQ